MSTRSARLPAVMSQPTAPRHFGPGLLLCGAIALAAIELGRAPWMAARGLSALTVAIVLGMLVGHTLYPRWAPAAGPGVALSKQALLRAGIVLYGCRLTLADIGHVGAAGVLTDLLMLGSTFALAQLIGRRLLRLDRDTCVLIGAGSAICGAAAVMATEPVLKARADKVAVAISTVVVFGTLAIGIYPALWRTGALWLPSGAHAYGLYTGSTVHEVAQVVAAAQPAGPEATGTAVIAKMVRVMMLAPFLMGLALWTGRARGDSSGAEGSRITRANLPWFALLFIGMVVAHSAHPWPGAMLRAANTVDTVLLAMAMAALGLTTHLSAVRQAGMRPLLLGAALFGWLVLGGALINHAVTALA